MFNPVSFKVVAPCMVMHMAYNRALQFVEGSLYVLTLE